MAERTPAGVQVLARRAVLAAMLLGLAVPPVLHVGKESDYRGFVAFGEVALAGDIPYDPAVEARHLSYHWATWAPGFVPFASALAVANSLARVPTRLLLQLANLACLGIVVLITAQWAGAPRDETAILVALLVPYRLVLDNFDATGVQINLLILASVLGGFHLLGTRRRWLGGLLYGLGASIKATPLLLLPYLAWRGRWRDMGAAAAGVAVAALLLPALIVGAEELGPWYDGWRGATARALAEYLEVGANQSALGALTRILGPSLATPVWWAFAGLVAAAGTWSLGHPFARVREGRTILELAVVLVCATFLSPIAWKHHYVTVVPLALCLFVAARTSSLPIRPLLWIAAAAVNLTGSDLIGRGMHRLEYGGLVLWVALVLTGIAMLELWRTRSGPAAGPLAS